MATSSSHSRLALTERDQRLLVFLYRFRLLSRDQIMALAGFGSLTRVNTRLAALVCARVLSRKMLPVYPGKGSAQALYFLGPRSSAFLEADSELVGRIVRQIARWELGQVEHVLAANQALVDATSAFATMPEARLLAFRTEPELRQLFSDRNLVPDGWIAFEYEGRRFNCFLEIDLHHEGLTEWRGKVLRYLEYAASGLHQECFGFRSFRVLVLAKSRARLKHLRQISEAAGRLFLFAEIAAVDARTILDPVWLSAAGDLRLRLTEA
jgi:hypothetical protein